MLVMLGVVCLGVVVGVMGIFFFLCKCVLVSDVISYVILSGVGFVFMVMVVFGGDGCNLIGLLLGLVVFVGFGLLCVNWFIWCM